MIAVLLYPPFLGKRIGMRDAVALLGSYSGMALVPGGVRLVTIRIGV